MSFSKLAHTISWYISLTHLTYSSVFWKVWFLIYAAYSYCSSPEKLAEAIKIKSFALAMRLTEVIFEAFPKALLQLYIAAQLNHLDFLLIAALTSSIISVAVGVIQGIWSIFSWSTKSIRKDRGVFFCLLYSPWVFSLFISFVVPLSFFAALENHSHPAYFILLCFFPLYWGILSEGVQLGFQN